MAKAAPKRSRRSKKAAAVRQRGNKRAAKRTRKRPKPPALARERRTLTEEPEGARATRDSDEGREAEDGIDGQPTRRGTG